MYSIYILYTYIHNITNYKLYSSYPQLMLEVKTLSIVPAIVRDRPGVWRTQTVEAPLFQVGAAVHGCRKAGVPPFGFVQETTSNSLTSCKP